MSVEFNRAERIATITLRGPAAPPPASADAMVALGAKFWPLQLARELDDAILNIRLNELDVAAIVFKSSGEPAQVLAYDHFLDANKEHWLAREIRHLWKRVLKRDRSHLALAGHADRAGLVLCRHARGTAVRQRPLLHADRQPRRRQQAAGDDRAHRRQFRRLSDVERADAARLPLPRPIPPIVDAAKAEREKMLDAEAAERLGLITFALDDIDWDDEVRVFLEERASFSPDSLTGLEANLRFAGPETMESKIFARLTAWQNWIFQRPNAIGEEGALKRYGTGQKPVFDTGGRVVR